jgi:hypothetical protein
MLGVSASAPRTRVAMTSISCVAAKNDVYLMIYTKQTLSCSMWKAFELCELRKFSLSLVDTAPQLLDTYTHSSSKTPGWQQAISNNAFGSDCNVPYGLTPHGLLQDRRPRMGLITVLLPARLDSYLLSVIRCGPRLIFVISKSIYSPSLFQGSLDYFEHPILPWYGNN